MGAISPHASTHFFFTGDSYTLCVCDCLVVLCYLETKQKVFRLTPTMVITSSLSLQYVMTWTSLPSFWNTSCSCSVERAWFTLGPMEGRSGGASEGLTVSWKPCVWLNYGAVLRHSRKNHPHVSSIFPSCVWPFLCVLMFKPHFCFWKRDLSGRDLRGDIPSLVRMTSLSYLNLSHNHLTGDFSALQVTQNLLILLRFSRIPFLMLEKSDKPSNCCFIYSVTFLTTNLLVLCHHFLLASYRSCILCSFHNEKEPEAFLLIISNS